MSDIRRPFSSRRSKNDDGNGVGTNRPIALPVVLGVVLFAAYIVLEDSFGCQSFLSLDAAELNALVNATGVSGLVALLVSFVAPRMKSAKRDKANNERVHGWRLFISLMGMAWLGWSGATSGYEQSLRKMSSGACAEEASSYLPR